MTWGIPYEWLGPLMFGTLLVLLFTGYPVALSLAGTALIFAAIAIGNGLMELNYLLLLPDRIYGFMSNSVLLAIPFFIFMGNILEKSRLAEDLLTTIGALCGKMRGGLALAVVLVGTLLAAATGVVGASVVAMGMISLPVMLRYGYSRSLACGVITASGTLGQIIPPSVVLVVLGDQLGVSVGDLFYGAMVPGLVLAGAYAVFVLVLAWLRPSCAPALPPEERTERGWALAKRLLLVLLPPLSLIVIVLGSIFAGIATATEGGALGAVGAMGLAALNKRLNLAALRPAVEQTARLTSMIMLLLIGSTAFSLVFRGISGDLWIEHLLTNLPGGWIGLILVANLSVFILGFFIDFFEIAFIIVPLLLPAAKKLGIDLTWFGVMLGMNLQTSFLTPPFGFALFYLRGVAPKEVTTMHLYRGAVPFIVIQVLILLAVIIFPGLVSK